MKRCSDIDFMSNSMKKILCIIVYLLILFLPLCSFADRLGLPSELTSIEVEAFRGDASLQGLVHIDNSVSSVGDNAFTETGIFALDFASGVERVGAQYLPSAVYVRFQGNTTITSLTGFNYVIAPIDSKAFIWASEHEINVFSLDEVISANGFIYQATDDGLILLSAEDNTELPETIDLAKLVNGQRLLEISPWAFYGCHSAKVVVLPESLLDEYQETLQQAYPTIDFIWREEFAIKSIVADTDEGRLGDSVTWVVETNSEEPVIYSYQLLLNDTVVQEVNNSNDDSFTTILDKTGTYQLVVSAAAMDGSVAEGSAILYVAKETMIMNLPSLISAGQNLYITIEDVPGALKYGIYIYSESAGELVYSTTGDSGTITVPGYRFNAGDYQVFGYAYGKTLTHAIPTIKLLKVSGSKMDAPNIAIYYRDSSASYANYTFEADSSYESIVYKNIETGVVSSTRNINNNRFKVTFRDHMFVVFSGMNNEKWTDWSEPVEITIDSDQLEAPEYNIVSEIPAGVDPTLELLNNYTNIPDICVANLAPGNQLDMLYDDDTMIYRKELYNGPNSLLGFGAVVNPGIYTLHVIVEDGRGGFRDTKKLITVVDNPNRPSPPPKSTVENQQVPFGQEIVLHVTSTDSDRVRSNVSIIELDGEETTLAWCSSVISATGDQTEWRFNPRDYWYSCVGATFYFSFSVEKDGVWSTLNEPIGVLMLEPIDNY